MSARRTLAFSSLDQVMPDVDRLMMAGYTKVGNWQLGQACNHLAKGVVGAIDGVDFKAPWLIRMVLAPIFLRQILKSGKMREQIKVPESILPKPGLDDRAEIEALRAALQLYAAHTGPLPDHPFFGRLTREQMDRFQTIHCAHHLSFLLPNEPGH